MLVAVFLWGGAPLLVRAIDAPALTIVTLSSWIAALVSLAIAHISGAPMTRRVMALSMLGGACFSGTQLLSVMAFQETSLAVASLINTMTPIVVLLAAVPLFGEHLRARQLAWAGVVLGGVVVVVLEGGSGGGATLFGDLLAFGSLLAGAAYLLVMKRQRIAGASANAYTAGVFLFAAAVETPAWLVTEQGHIALRSTEWLWLVLLATFGLSIGLGLMVWAQKHVRVGVSSMLTLGGTIITAAGGWAFFDQHLNGEQIAGGLVVLLGLIGMVRNQLGTPSGEPARAAQVSGTFAASP